MSLEKNEADEGSAGLVAPESQDVESSPSQPGLPTTPARTLGPPPIMHSISRRSGGGLGGGGAIPSLSLGQQNQAPKSTQKSKFVLTADIPDEDIKDTNVLVPKDKRGAEGSKDYNSIMKMATEALSTKFGVAKHKIVTTEGADSSSGNHTKSLRIQNSICDLILRAHEGQQRCKRYDFMSILLIPNFKPSSSADPSDWWDESEINLWEDWDKISERQAISWQYCINKRFSEEDRTSSVWLMVFLVNSCSPELNKEIEKKLDKLPNNQRGGVIYLFYLLTSSFKMSREVKKAIQSYLSFWRDKGLSKVQGENVAQAELLIVGCCKRLDAVGSLGSEYVIDVLEGLCVCSCPEFKSMFEVMLNMAKLGNYDVLSTISQSSTPMEMIEAILTKAVAQYDLLADTGHWNIPNPRRGGGGGGNPRALTIAPPKRKCFNCGKEGCSVGECKQPLDEARIKRNKDKYFEQKRASQGNGNQGGGGSNTNNQGGGGSNGSGKKQVDKSTPEYQRKKWESAGLVMVGNMLKCKCPQCGPNFTHSGRNHGAWKAGNYTLPSTHPLFKYNQELGNTVPSADNSGPTDRGATPAAATGGDSLTLSRTDLSSKISHFERNSTDPNASSIAGAIRSMLLN